MIELLCKQKTSLEPFGERERGFREKEEKKEREVFKRENEKPEESKSSSRFIYKIFKLFTVAGF